ncbi:MAG TPA: RdgB/HAM1 family non-canonical purine NTP pyrophosphatase [Candidatus Stackebrandtia faecavium]|nr:RdgB/HAM1 family non-canonical purine NTP pyrophosphatase [Candidatus Stackebrandtia faecavium]
MKILLASRNKGKLEELRRILADHPSIELVGLDDVDPYPEAPETAATFAGNAEAKALDALRYTGLPSIADDSGLAVDALNGMPGVLSARWSGTHGDDTANLELLLNQMGDVPDERRSAAFVCAVAFAQPNVETQIVFGRMPGRVIREPRGANGFGYDPIFVPDGHSETAAELSSEAKDAISHRGEALREFAKLLD